MRKFPLLQAALVCMLAFVIALNAGAQNRTISGRITDDKGNGVPSASVTVKGTNRGTTTDASGNFSITVPSNARTLTISSVGFADQEVDIAGKSTVNVNLAGTTSNLNEVVVIGYGTARRSDITGAISSVKERAPASSRPRNTPGNASTLLIWLGWSDRPVATTAAYRRASRRYGVRGSPSARHDRETSHAVEGPLPSPQTPSILCCECENPNRS